MKLVLIYFIVLPSLVCLCIAVDSWLRRLRLHLHFHGGDSAEGKFWSRLCEQLLFFSGSIFDSHWRSVSLLLTDDGPRSVPPPGLLLQKLVQPSGPAGRQRLAGLLLPAVSIRDHNQKETTLKSTLFLLFFKWPTQCFSLHVTSLGSSSTSMFRSLCPQCLKRLCYY